MGRQRGTDDTFRGRGGQLAVMAEVLYRLCNAAIPEVDVGTDVFAFLDHRVDVARIQVKTARGARYENEEGYSARFDVPMRQLERTDGLPLYYALAVRLEGRWADFLVIGREQLDNLWNGPQRFGTENHRTGDLALTVQFRPGNVRCGEVDLTPYRNAWDQLPPLQPLPVLATQPGEEAAPPGEPAPPQT